MFTWSGWTGGWTCGERRVSRGRTLDSSLAIEAARARAAGEPDAGSRLAGDFLALAGDFLALAGDFLATVFFLAGA